MAKKQEPMDQATSEKLEQLRNEELSLNLKADSKAGRYKPNKKMRAIRRQAYERYYDMRDDDARKLAEEDWEMADKEYRMYFPELDDSNFNIDDDQRSNLHLPDAFAAIQAHNQETIDRKSRPALEGTEESDEPMQDFCNDVMTYNMNTTGFDYQWYLGKLNAGIRGTSFFYDYYRLEKREIMDPTGVDEDGNLTYTPREVVDFDDDYTEWIENEYVYIDEKARHIDFAIDGVRREILNIREFRRIYMNMPGFKDVDRVTQGGDTTTRSVFKLPKDINEEDVEVLHYYNRAIDAYWVVANNVVIRDTPLPTKHKELPFAVLYHYQVPGRFWGVGIPKIIHYLSEERRSIRNLNMDRQHLNINKMFLHNNMYDIDDEDLVSRPNGLISVDTNGQSIRDAIVPLEFGDVPASYFRTEEILLEDIRRAHGIDDRIQGVNMGGTATEAAILKESALKRVNMISTIAEMDTILRIGRLKWSNIQFFYPAGRMEKISIDNREKSKQVHKKITVQGRKYSVVNDEGRMRLKMDEVKGASTFALDKKFAKYLQGNFDITVSASVYAPPSKAIQQSKVLETFTAVMSNPQTAGSLDPTKAVRRLLKVNDEDPDNWMRSDNVHDEREMEMLAEAENMVMAAGQPLAPTKGATEAHTLGHLIFTRTSDFEKLPDEIQAIIMEHVMGEHENNPNTGSAADLMAQFGLGEAAPGEGEAPIPPNPVGVNPMGLAADTQNKQIQVADAGPPTNFTAPA